MQTQSIAQLEEISNAASAAASKAEDTLLDMIRLGEALIRVEDVSVSDLLPEAVKVAIRGLGAIGADLDKRIKAQKVEIDRLEDVSQAAAAALNAAPEEAS